jgi:hypothetical protein
MVGGGIVIAILGLGILAYYLVSKKRKQANK